MNDLRFAARVLRKNPGFALAAVLTLTLGIGANAAIFSVVNAVLLKPLPYSDPERLYLLSEFNRQQPDSRMNVTSLDFLDWQSRTQAFQHLAAYIGTGFTFTGDADAELTLGELVSPELFLVLGVRPWLGRVLTGADAEVGRDQVIVLSYALWQRRYGGDPSAVGRSVTVNGTPHTIVGVMPASFSFPSRRYELWAPFAFRGNTPQWINRSAHFLRVVGKLKPGVVEGTARAEIDAVARALEQEYPESNRNVGAVMTPLTETVVGNVRPALIVLLAAVGFVLLIACTNVTNLLLARASARQQELAVRAALGADRMRIVRQLLTESLLLYVAGALAGLLLAAWGVELVKRLGPELPRLEEVALDGRVILVVMGVSLATALVFGLLPALASSSLDVSARLKSVSRGSTRDRQRLRSALIAGEVALSVVLLVGAGLALRSFLRLQAVNPGFNPEGVLTFAVPLSQSRYGDADRVREVYQRLLDRLDAAPHFSAVGATTHLPLTGQELRDSVTIEGETLPPAAEGAMAGMRGISGDYFRTLAIPVLQGRSFTPADRELAPRVAIVNTTFARRFLPGRNPIGARVRFGGPEDDSPWIAIVGVVGDVTHRGLDATPGPEVYVPHRQLDPLVLTQWARSGSFVVRMREGARGAADAIRSIVREVDRDLPIAGLQPMTALVSDAVAQPRFRSTLLAIFAAVALALAAVGIFGVMSYFVAQRTREIGIRMALGASPHDILRLVVGHGLVLVAFGLGIGLVGALALTRSMQALLFRVAPTDPVTFAVVSIVLGAMAFVASYVPARRAVRVDPLSALRAE